MTEHGLKQPKMLPCLIVLECQTIGRCNKHHKTSANKCPLTGGALSLIQIKCTHPCLHAFTMTEHRLKQPKMLPSHVIVDCQQVKID